jgi:hypothetical protein
MGKTAYEKTLKCRNNILTGINKEGLNKKSVFRNLKLIFVDKFG